MHNGPPDTLPHAPESDNFEIVSKHDRDNWFTIIQLLTPVLASSAFTCSKASDQQNGTQLHQESHPFHLYNLSHNTINTWFYLSSFLSIIEIKLPVLSFLLRFFLDQKILFSFTPPRLMLKQAISPFIIWPYTG